MSARVRVADIRVEASFRRRVQRTIAVLEDETGTIEATWFGRRYIERRLHVDQRVIVSGKLKHFGRKRTLDNPDFQPEGNDDELLHVGRIVPVYRLTAGITAQTLRRAVREALDRAGRDYPEYLPGRASRAAKRLEAIGESLEQAHFPVSFDGRDAALRRVAFDELLALQLGMVGRRRQRGRDSARPVEVDEPTDRESARGAIEASLGRKLDREVRLTDDQDAAIRDLRADLGRATPMLRLLQGDVGSGKTAVAAYALAAAARAGPPGRAARADRPPGAAAPPDAHRAPRGRRDPGRAPDRLADGREHAPDARARRVGHGPDRRRHARADPGASDVRGAWRRRHRRAAPVRRRAAGPARGEGRRRPRAARPADDRHARSRGRSARCCTPTSTCRTSGRRRRAASRSAPASGGRTSSTARGRRFARRPRPAIGSFVVVPLIDEEDAAEGDGDRATGGGFWDSSAPAAEAEAVRLRELLAPLRVGLVHGRLKAADRDAEMARFRDGDLDVLVGTTVVEVGVDVPEATMMVVQGADRFGLAQLHQLRGRVGRGEVASFCVLVSDSTDETAQARLKAVAEIRDGFELAERDWELRREGDVLGLVQSGLPRLRIASLQRDDHRELAVRAREAAEAMLDESGELRPGLEALDRGDGRAAGWRASPRPSRPGRPEPDGSALRRHDPAGSSAGRVIAGSARGDPPRRAGGGDAPARRSGQAGAVRDPRADDPRPALPRPLCGERRGRNRGAVARRLRRRLRGVRSAGRPRDRAEPRGHRAGRPAGRRLGPQGRWLARAGGGRAEGDPREPQDRSRRSSSTRPTTRPTSSPGRWRASPRPGGASSLPLTASWSRSTSGRRRRSRIGCYARSARSASARPP